MFNVTVKVPRITSEAIAEFEKITPGFSSVAFVPTIDSGEKAAIAGRAIANKSLTGYEYISEVTSVTETAEGWTVIYRVSGD